MNETFVRFSLLGYAVALVGQAMVAEEKINIFQGKIEVPLDIMYKFDLKNIFQTTFVPINTMLVAYVLPKPYRLNRKTRPPNIQWAQ